MPGRKRRRVTKITDDVEQSAKRRRLNPELIEEGLSNDSVPAEEIDNSSLSAAKRSKRSHTQSKPWWMTPNNDKNEIVSQSQTNDEQEPPNSDDDVVQDIEGITPGQYEDESLNRSRTSGAHRPTISNRENNKLTINNNNNNNNNSKAEKKIRESNSGSGGGSGSEETESLASKETTPNPEREYNNTKENLHNTTRSATRHKFEQLPKLNKKAVTDKNLEEMIQHTNEFLKHSKYLGNSLQTLIPLMTNSLHINQQQTNKYNELAQEIKKTNKQFEKKLHQMENNVNEGYDQKTYEQIKAQMRTQNQLYEELKKKLSTANPVLDHENKSLKNKLQEEQRNNILLQQELTEIKNQLQQCQEQHAEKISQMESRISELEEQQTRELERVHSNHDIEVDNLKLKCREKESQMNDLKEEIKRKERDEATKMASLFSQLERENEILKHEIRLLQQNKEENTEGTDPHTENISHSNVMKNGEFNMIVDSPNSAMNSPYYGDMTSLITAVKMRRSTMSIHSPLSQRSKNQLQLESDLESLKQELEKYKIDIISYQTQTNENKERIKNLQDQVYEAQMQRKKALDEREMLMQMIGLYEIMTATKINYLRGNSLPKGKNPKNRNSISNNDIPEKESNEDHESKHTELSTSKQPNHNEEMMTENHSSAVTDEISDKESRTVRFNCKTLNPQTKSMLEFVLSTYMNFVDYNLVQARNFTTLPEFLSSEMSFSDSSAPLFIKELLDIMFGKETRITGLEETSAPRAVPPTEKIIYKQTSLVNTISNQG